MTVLERIDLFCRRVVLDPLLIPERPRALRWPPFLALAAIVGSYVLLVSAEGRFAPWRFMVFLTLYVCGSVAAVLMRQMGPRLSPTQGRPLDERELTIQARASALAGRTLSVLAMTGCFYMAYADLLHAWRPSTTIDWVFLGLVLQSCSLLLPTLIASWLQPRPVADDED